MVRLASAAEPVDAVEGAAARKVSVSQEVSPDLRSYPRPSRWIARRVFAGVLRILASEKNMQARTPHL
jgi:hypothetical protein